MAQPIPKDYYPRLLNELKADSPRSIHAYSFLSTLLKWKEKDDSLDLKIISVDGNENPRFIAFYCQPTKASGFWGSIHRWHEGSNEELNVTLKEVIGTPWEAQRIIFTSLTPETEAAVGGQFIDKWDKSSHTVYWVSKEEAAQWTVETPPGSYLSFLSAAHAKEVDSLWPYQYDGSLDLFVKVIQLNFGMGLFDSDSHELVAWALHWLEGGVGALHTKDAYKRKGYGRAVLKATAKEIAQRGMDVHLNVWCENKAAHALMKSVGFQEVSTSMWFYVGY